jgi:DNA helicase-2/ATP-dependent DNA helicase PcrA
MSTADREEFEEAVAARDRNLLVIAPPGCGKTELLALRAQFLIPTLGPGQRILALTFSNKAKANLNARLVKVLGAERKRRYVTVHNFHGHAAEIVRSHGRALAIAPDFPMPDKHTQDTATEPYLEGLGEREAHEMRRRIDDELREAKQGPYDDTQVIARLVRNADERTLDIERERQRNGQIFYDDLLRHAQRLLRVEQVARLYRTHYGAVLVDEFQDLSPQQLDIALRSCDTSRSFVGDPLQGIYSWTGARPVQVERVLRRISGEPRSLGLSYRSSPRVLNLLGVVSRQLGGQALQSHEPARWFEGGITAGVALRSGVDEARFIRETCDAILARQPSATIGVICRSGWRRKPIDAHFAAAGTPCTRWDLAVDDARIIDIINDGVARLGGAPDLDVLKADLFASVEPTDVDTTSDLIEALDQLGELAGQAGSVAAALAQLRIRENSDEPIGPGVHLLNAHTGKGQQFDWVFIPGFEKGNMPSFLARTQAQRDEEHRVLLVMISRARHGVVITRAQTLISKAGNPYDPDPSPWALSLRPALTNVTALKNHLAQLPAIP